MPIEIRMPALSPTMTEGNLARWLKKEGDRVAPGDVVAEIETDKATMEVEAVDEGTLGKIVIGDGTEGVPVNTVIGVLLEEGEDAAALADSKPSDSGKAPEPETAKPDTKAEERASAAARRASPAAARPTRRSDPRRGRRPKTRRRAMGPIAGGGSSRARSPGAWPSRLASISPGSRAAARTVGSSRPTSSARSRLACRRRPGRLPRRHGPPRRLRVPKRRVRPKHPRVAPMRSIAPPAEPHEEIKLSNMRKVIARRLTEAKQSIPHYYLTLDCELDALLKLRQELNARADADYKLSVNDFVIKALALALRKVPAANRAWGGDKLYQYQDVDIGVAVAIPDGLVTPLIRKADQKGLATISKEMRDLSARARDPGGMKLKPEEYQGGSFSISNLGMYGIREFAAVINPPQAGILAVGAGEQRPVVKDGALATATMMTATLSADHRLVDGATGAELLAAFKRYVEEPLSMLL